MNQTVSVIIPYFEAASTIERAIKSLNAQSYNSISIIVIDDCSEDILSLEFLKSLTKYPIRLVRNRFNIGADASINIGYELIDSGYICVLDADDELPADSIKARASTLSEGHDLVFGTTERIYKGHVTIIKNIEPTLESVLDWLNHKHASKGINITTAMYKANLRKTAGFRLVRGQRGSHEDYEYALRLILNALKPTSIMNLCYTYNLSDTGAMNTVIKKDKVSWEAARVALEKEYIVRLSTIIRRI